MPLPDAPEMVGAFTDTKLPPGGHVRSLAWNGTSLDHYYVGYAGGRVFRVDQGVWTECAPLAGEPYDMSLGDGGVVYATTLNDDLAYSQDSCASWTVVSPPTGAFTMQGITNAVYTGGYDGIWLYVLGGTFSRATSPFDGVYIFDLCRGSSDRLGVAADGVFGVRVAGTWHTVDITPNRAYHIVFNLSDANLVYAVTEGGIYKSTNAGVSFTLLAPGYYDTLGIDPANSQHMLAMAGGELEETFDDFGTVNGDKRNAVTGGGWPSEIAFDASGTVVMATENGVFSAPATTLSWQRVDTGVGAWWIDAVAETSTALYAGASGDLFVSGAGGAWTRPNSIQAQSSAVYGLTVTPANPDRVYLMGDALERSDDRGTTFTTVIPSSQTDGWSFYGLTEQGSRLWAASYARLTYSDSGGPFTAVNTGGSHFFRRVIVRGTEIIAVSDNGVYWSTDNGTSFITSNTGLADLDLKGALVALPDGRIAIGNGDGLWTSTARGTTWTRIGFASKRVRDLLVTPSNAIVAAVQESGVFVSTDMGASWSEIAGLSTYRPWALAIGRNNTLLVGTQGHGLFRTALP